MEILIFDSAKNIADRIADLITENVPGVYPQTTASIKEADQLFLKSNVTVVLLDMKFPSSGGIELLKKIKAHNSNVVVVVLYSIIDEFSYKQCVAYNANYLLDKYNDFEKIPGIIKEIKLKGETVV